MSLFDLFWKRSRQEAPQDLVGPKTGQSEDVGEYALGGYAAGVAVTHDSSLQVASVYSAVRILAEDAASLPLHLYFRADGARQRAVWRPEYRLLYSQPNGYQTAFSLREAMMASLLLWGNAYCEIERNGNGDVVGLHFIRPQNVDVRMDADDQEPVYSVNKVELSPRDIFHVHAFSDNGITGRSILKLARESIGLSKATEEYGSNWFANGAAPGGVLQMPGRIKDAAQLERIRSGWENRHKGPKRSGGVAILEEGMQYQQIGMPPEDSQFLETRKFQVNEIARWFRLPPHMLGDLERATFSNIEEQSLEYVKYTLRPWLVRIEQEAQRQLLQPGMPGPYYYEHLVEDLLRGDIETRYSAYETALQNGWMSINEVRRRENLNPIDGGDVHRYPLNMGEVGHEEETNG